MSLKSRIDAALQASTDLRWSPWSEPELRGLLPAKDDADYIPAVITRFTGSIVLGSRRRGVVEVVMILAASPPDDELDIQDWEDTLVDILRGVNNAFPDLLTTTVRYDWQIGRPLQTNFGGSSGFRGTGSRPYVANIVQVVDA